jgi:hypothetical protein
MTKGDKLIHSITHEIIKEIKESYKNWSDIDLARCKLTSFYVDFNIENLKSFDIVDYGFCYADEIVRNKNIFFVEIPNEGETYFHQGRILSFFSPKTAEDQTPIFEIYMQKVIYHNLEKFIISCIHRFKENIKNLEDKYYELRNNNH